MFFLVDGQKVSMQSSIALSTVVENKFQASVVSKESNSPCQLTVLSSSLIFTNLSLSNLSSEHSL